jgi:capsular polysaccharide biosynthesis protein
VNLRDYLTVLRSRGAIVLFCALIGAGEAATQVVTTPQAYGSTASVFFAVSAGKNSGDLSRGFSYAQGLATSYAQLATQPLVLTPVISELGLTSTPAALARSVTANVPADTVIVNVHVSDASATRAAQVANAIAQQLLSTVNSQITRTARDAQPVRATVASTAEAARSPASPRGALTVTIGLLLGLVAGAVLAFLRDLFDSRVRRPLDVAQVTTAPVLGAVPAAGARRDRSLWRRRSREAEARERELKLTFQQMRALRALRSVAFTSASDGLQAALTVRSLGQQLANAGVRTLLVDADMVRPALSDAFGAAGEPGLTTVLRQDAAWRDVVQERHEALHVLPAGPAWAGSSLALHRKDVDALLRELTAQYDVVLVKAPPVLRAADGLMLAAIADGVILVADAPAMRRSDLSDEVHALGVANVAPAGIVLVA